VNQTTQPIANLEAEQAVLGSILLDPAVLDEIPALAARDFYRETHAVIFQAMSDLWRDQHAVDVTLLGDLLTERKQFDLAGGLSFMVNLITATPTSVHAAYYAEIVARKASRRRLVRAAEKIAAAAYDESVNDNELFGRSVACIEAAVAKPKDENVLLWGDSFAVSADNALAGNARANENRPVLSFPWKALSFVNPLERGGFGIVAAETGVGKTIFLECAAEVWARRGFQVAFFHTELTHETMLRRRMCRWTGLTMAEVATIGLTDVIQQADELARGWPGGVNYIYASGWSAGQVVAKARQLARQGLNDVVILDYFQDLTFTEYVKGQMTADMRGGDARLLKAYTEQAEVGRPVLTGSQYRKRPAGAKSDPNSDMYGTSILPQKASLVLQISRERLTAPLYGDDRMLLAGLGELSPVTTVECTKQTGGAPATKKLWTAASRFLMADIAE